MESGRVGGDALIVAGGCCWIDVAVDDVPFVVTRSGDAELIAEVNVLAVDDVVVDTDGDDGDGIDVFCDDLKKEKGKRYLGT